MQSRRAAEAAGCIRSRGAQRFTVHTLALAAAACLLLLGQPAQCSGRHVRRRATLEEMVQTSITRIPGDYQRMGHRESGWNVTRQHSSGAAAEHHTVMFTAEGSVYRKKLGDTSHLPRRLSEIQTDGQAARRLLQSGASASLNPDLACQGCPTTDTRVQVNDTEITPWDSVGLLARQNANSISNGIAQCSGALIGVQRQHVLTAGHCLVDSSTSQDNVDKITFYPGLSGSDLPFGTLSAVKARVLQQYVEERSITPLALNYDFALITLSAGAPKGTTYLDIAAGDGTTRYDLTTAGYPADKAGQDMWAVNCSNVQFDFTNGPGVLGCGSQCSNIVVHDCLSYEGQSGSAIWSTEGNNRTVRAVLTGALQESDGTTYNVATQMNAFVYNTVVGWYNEDVTDGLTLAPPAPPASSSPSNNGNDFVTLGDTSWWRAHWWWVVLPVAVVLGLALLAVIVGCLRRGGCCGVRRKPSRPIVGATYPPPTGAAYPNQQYYGGYGQGAPQGAPPPQPQQQAWAPNPQGQSNWERYGPGFYNGYGTSGNAYPADVHGQPSGYPPAARR